MRYLVAATALGGPDALSLGRILAGEADLTVCVVVPRTWDHPSPARVDAEYAAYLQRYAEDAIDQAREFLGDGVRAEYVSTSAPSASEGLINAAVESGAAMIILGSARHGPLGRFTAGGIANEMLHASPVPVALAPQGYRPSPAARLSRVTCAFSGSTQSRSAFDAAEQLSRHHGVPLRLATFVITDRQMYPSQVGYDAEAMVTEQWRAQAREAQEKALSSLPEDVAVEAIVEDGRDWDDAIHSLPWEEGEVLVVGSSRLGPVARVFLGSNSTKILRHSPVPVVVIPQAADVHLDTPKP